MRFTILVASIAAVLATDGQAADRSKESDRSRLVCMSGNPAIAKGGGKAPVRKLGELPAGNMVLTVIRQQDGCIKPVIVRYGLGRQK